MERKHIRIDVKAVDETGTVEGYGSVFGVRDRGGDVVVAGAFAESLRGSKPKMLFNHDPAQIVGVWDEAAEDEAGLRLKGRLADTPKGRELRALLAMKALDGLSIGYRTVKAESRGGARQIMQAEVWEVSFVAFPMNRAATVDAVKALDGGDTAPLVDAYRRAGLDLGLPHATADAAARAAVKAARPEAPGMDALRAALEARHNL